MQHTNITQLITNLDAIENLQLTFDYYFGQQVVNGTNLNF